MKGWSGVGPISAGKAEHPQTMICLLCEPEDDDALWLAAALLRHGEEVECVLPEELMVASVFTCRIDSTAVTSTLRLRDGRVLDADVPHLVINRLVDLPASVTGGSTADETYLAEEWRAAATAWLRTMRCPVLNPPRAAFLAGPQLPPAAWRAIASAWDVPVRAWRSDRAAEEVDVLHVVCLAGQCVDPTGALPPEIEASLVRMSRHVGTPLLGATFDRSEGLWALLDATARPRLAPAGARLVDAVIACAKDAGGGP